MNKNSIKGYYTVFCLLGLTWGTNFLFMRLAVQVISPLQVVWLRVLFGALPVLAFGIFRKVLKISDLKNAHHFLAMAIGSTIIPHLGFAKGTQFLPSGAVGAMTGIIPLVTALLTIIFLNSKKISDKLSTTKVWGLILGCLGVLLVAQVHKLSSGTSSDLLKGTLYTLLGCLGYAAGMVYARRFISPLGLSSVALACYQTILASVLLTIFVPFDGVSAIFDNLEALTALALGLGLFGTGIAFIMYYYIIEKLGPVTASSVFYIPPIVALAIGALLANEWITPLQFLGTGAILLGVYFARSSGKIN